MSPLAPPFVLRPAGPSRPLLYSAALTDGRLYVQCAGDLRAPHPVLAATLAWLVERLPEVEAAVQGFLRSLSPGDRISISTRPGEGFGVVDCGFEGPLLLVGLEALRPEAPSTAIAVCTTGLPDEYVRFRVELDGLVPRGVVADIG